MSDFIRVGRIIRASDLDTVGALGLDGDRMAAAGRLGTDLAEIAEVAEQWRGLASDPFELTKPVYYDDDRIVDGFYTFQNARIDVEPGSIDPDDGYGQFPWQFVADRVVAAKNALAQSHLYGTLVPNDHSLAIGGTTPWHAVPLEATLYDNGGDTTAGVERAGDGGSVVYYEPASQLNYDASPTHRLAIADWYSMAATIEHAGIPIIGAQIPPDTNWSMHNSLMRITPGTSTLLKMEAHDGAGWFPDTEDEQGLDIGYWDGTPFSSGSWTSVTADAIPFVLRNTPWETKLRLVVGFAPATDASSRAIVDISMRRGSRFARITVKSNYSAHWGVTFTDATGGAVANTGNTGIHRNANDDDGNRWVGWTAETNSRETTDCRCVLTTAGTRVGLAVAMVLDYSSAAAPDDLDSLEDQVFAGEAEDLELIEA